MPNLRHAAAWSRDAGDWSLKDRRCILILILILILIPVLLVYVVIPILVELDMSPTF